MFKRVKTMKPLKISLLAITIIFLSFTAAHKYYVSVTQIEYIEEQESLQIITRIFIDDIEKLFRDRYDDNITLAGEEEPEIIDYYVEKYVKSKISIRINGKSMVMSFVGREYEDDIMYVYLEIENVKDIKSFEVSNQVLFDLYDEQQNIVRTKIYSKNKSFVLIAEKNKGLLNFN